MNTLFLFVEGSDDERFVRKHYANKNIKPINYANMTPKSVNNMLRGIKHGNSSYLFFTDSDGCSSDVRIQRTVNKYTECESSQVIVVCFEIESWYLAGLNQQDSQKMGVKFVSITDSITKEQFNAMIPKKMSRLDFLLEILQKFDCEGALQRNASYRKFRANALA